MATRRLTRNSRKEPQASLPNTRPNTGGIADRATPASRLPAFPYRFPWYAYCGLLLNVVAWSSSWLRIGPWAYTFFAQWFGFILVLDGLNVARRGSSLLTRGPARFALLFALSVPFWWIFEALNAPVNNWHYHFDRPYSALAYNLIASLNFSTVLPAVMEMAELLSSIPALRPRLAASEIGPRLSRRAATLLMGVGVALLALPILMPRYAFGLIWLCLIFLIDPINNLAGRKSAFAHWLARDWRFIASVTLAGICCGFFWELWNYFALPKWTYSVPFFDGGPHLFEMPLPGYSGYLPFAIELFVMYQFALLLIGQREDNLVI